MYKQPRMRVLFASLLVVAFIAACSGAFLPAGVLDQIEATKFIKDDLDRTIHVLRVGRMIVQADDGGSTLPQQCVNSFQQLGLNFGDDKPCSFVDDTLNNQALTNAQKVQALCSNDCSGRYVKILRDVIKCLADNLPPGATDQERQTIGFLIAIFSTAPVTLEFFCARREDGRFCGEFYNESIAFQVSVPGSANFNDSCARLSAMGCCGQAALQYAIQLVRPVSFLFPSAAIGAYGAAINQSLNACGLNRSPPCVINERRKAIIVRFGLSYSFDAFKNLQERVRNLILRALRIDIARNLNVDVDYLFIGVIAETASGTLSVQVVVRARTDSATEALVSTVTARAAAPSSFTYPNVQSTGTANSVSGFTTSASTSVESSPTTSDVGSSLPSSAPSALASLSLNSLFFVIVALYASLRAW